ncbi:hypothetical protein WME97_06610 [Sorangium sp. So ce367]|uniref:hypothetical protein n=1 Tax=Sorangium sp. So ce367 TaxID=3133305 RepID=UPI003F60349A
MSRRIILFTQEIQLQSLVLALDDLFRMLPSRLLDGRKIRLCDGHHRAGFALTAIAARHAPG